MEVIKGRDAFRATEASEEDGVQWITILKEGTSENNRRYRKSTLKKAVDDRVYENMRMFVDHDDGPPLKRSMRDLVSAITTTKLDESFPDGKARVRGAVEWIDEDWQKKIEKGKDHVGVSHDALLKGVRSMKDGRRFEDINEIPRVNSVDWVIYPSAGGGFENSFYAQEGVEMADAIDWDAIDEDMLKEKAPDLYKALTVRAKEGEDDEEDDEDEEEKEPVPGAKKNRKAPISKLNGKVERQIESIVESALEKDRNKREARAGVLKKYKDAVDKSTLPDLVKARVTRSFEGVEEFTETRAKEAIKEAETEVAAIAGPRVRGMGPSGETSASKTSNLGRAHEAVATIFGVDPLAPKKKDSKGKKSTDKDDDDEEEE